jgi:hypothetical protein
MTKLHENTLKLQELLSARERWTTKESASDPHGNAVLPRNPAAVCWCLVGGAAKVTKSKKEYGELVTQMRRKVLSRGTRSVSLFNGLSQYKDIKVFLADLVESTK